MHRVSVALIISFYNDNNNHPSTCNPLYYTVNLEKIALVKFLHFFAFSLGRKIKIRNDL